jgi:hypothetical protein
MKNKTITITLNPELLELAKKQSKETLGKQTISGWFAYLITGYSKVGNIMDFQVNQKPINK